MEREICRRETTRKITTIFKYLAYACGAFGALALMAVIIVATVDSAWEYLFNGDSSYTIPLIIAVVSALFAVCFFIVERNMGIVTSFWVLTNKRIYNQTVTSKIKQFESYNLNTVTYYGLSQTVAKGKTHLTLVFKTPTDTVKLIVDEEFYNEFVNAVNVIG